MAMLKEGDFIRNGNTKKVNNLRRVEQDGIWEALKTGESAGTRLLYCDSALLTLLFSNSQEITNSIPVWCRRSFLRHQHTPLKGLHSLGPLHRG